MQQAIDSGLPQAFGQVRVAHGSRIRQKPLQPPRQRNSHNGQRTDGYKFSRGANRGRGRGSADGRQENGQDLSIDYLVLSCFTQDPWKELMQYFRQQEKQKAITDEKSAVQVMEQAELSSLSNVAIDDEDLVTSVDANNSGCVSDNGTFFNDEDDGTVRKKAKKVT